MDWYARGGPRVRSESRTLFAPRVCSLPAPRGDAGTVTHQDRDPGSEASPRAREGVPVHPRVVVRWSYVLYITCSTLALAQAHSERLVPGILPCPSFLIGMFPSLLPSPFSDVSDEQLGRGALV